MQTHTAPSPPVSGPGTAFSAEDGEVSASNPRARDESLHARNIRLRREYLALSSEASVASDPSERERLRASADAIAGDFVSANAGLAGSQARRFRPSDGYSEDYQAVAFQGLWEAFTRWDPDRGVAFSTFSRQFISGRLMRAVRRTEFSHLTQQEWSTRATAVRARAELERSYGREPTFAEVAAHCAIPVTLVERMFAPTDLSLDRKVTEDLDLHSSVADERLPEVVEGMAAEADLEPLLAELNDRQLFAVMFTSPSLIVEPTKLTVLAQRAGIPRNGITPDAFSGSVRMARSLLRQRLDRDPSPEEVAEEMGLGSSVGKVATAMRRSDALPELRSSLLRCRNLVADRAASSAPSDRIAQASLQVESLFGRLCVRLAEVTADISDQLEVPDEDADGGFRPADPETVLEQVWASFREGWPEGMQEGSVVADMRGRLVPPHRRARTPVAEADRLVLSAGWVRNRISAVPRG